MTDIIIKQAHENDIPIIEEIMIDVVNFLDSIGQPQWERQNVSWQGLSRYFKVDDFYIASIDDNLLFQESPNSSLLSLFELNV